MKPRLLDLFCGAGGATVGYQRAGFEVWGVDILPQPNYPGSDFICGDAIEWGRLLAGSFDVVHASPPCQDFTTLRALQRGRRYPRLIDDVREMLVGVGVPYIIENVVGSQLCNPILLCGSSFGLGVRRHRLFEMSHMPVSWPQCEHDQQLEPIDVTGVGGPGGRHRKPKNLAHAREAMGIDWMTRKELSQAIPPAYTEWIGRQLMEILTVAA